MVIVRISGDSVDPTINDTCVRDRGLERRIRKINDGDGSHGTSIFLCSSIKIHTVQPDGCQ
jgi:hypothetical protein